MVHLRRRIATVLAAFATAASAHAGEPPLAPRASDPFFDDTGLHTINLAINSKDWENLKVHYLENTYYPCDFRWRDQTVRNIGIRSRGTGSRSGVKPGLRVDFNRYSPDQRFLGLKSVILRNNTQDPSGMHERIAMLFFRRMGLPAVREAHAKLFVNNQFDGVYTIVESVDKDYLQSRYGEDGGWLYKYDYNVDDKPYYLEWRGSDPALYVPSPFKPETREDDPRPEVIRDWIRVINQDSAAVFRQTIAAYLDMTAFVKHIAIEAFLGDNDGFNGNYGTNNFYLYRYATNTRLVLIPWDKSNTFVDGYQYPPYHNITDMPEAQRNRLTMRAFESPDLSELYRQTLLECARSLNAIDESAADQQHGWMEAEVAREYAQIKAAIYDDRNKPFSNDDFEAEVLKLTEFARQRGAYVQSVLGVGGATAQRAPGSPR